MAHAAQRLVRVPILYHEGATEAPLSTPTTSSLSQHTSSLSPYSLYYPQTSVYSAVQNATAVRPTLPSLV